MKYSILKALIFVALVACLPLKAQASELAPEH